MKLHVLGYALDIAANQRGAAHAPEHIRASATQHALPLEWQAIYRQTAHAKGINALSEVQQVCTQLANAITPLVRENKRFLTIGGDHSAAIGTWSGAAQGLGGPLGLIWIDAHMDAHTPNTSLTQNIHGMPVAVLLGEGHTALTHMTAQHPSIKPEHLVLIGIRSFEPSEAERLKAYGVTIYDMPMVEEHGLPTIMRWAIERVTKETAGFGVSIDIDAIDPIEAPAVSTPEVAGLKANDLLASLPLIAQHPKFIGAEIAEFNPKYDSDQKTELLIHRLIQKLFPFLRH